MKTFCQETLSLFTVHRESQGPVTSVKSHCSSPRSIRSKPTLLENAVKLPKLTLQLQMLQAGCTDTPAQRDVSFMTHPCSPLCHVVGSVTPLPYPTAQPWGMDALTQEETHQSPFPEPLPPLSQLCPITHMQHIISTASFHCYFYSLQRRRTQDRQQCPQDLVFIS